MCTATCPTSSLFDMTQGKGSARRPQSVSDEEFARRWERIFPKAAEERRKFAEYQKKRWGEAKDEC